MQMMRLIDQDRVPRISRKKPATFRATFGKFPAQRVDANHAQPSAFLSTFGKMRKLWEASG